MLVQPADLLSYFFWVIIFCRFSVLKVVSPFYFVAHFFDSLDFKIVDCVNHGVFVALAGRSTIHLTQRRTELC